jgi:hypothetical protein
MKLRGLAPNFCIHVPVSDLYIPTIGPQKTEYSKVGGPIVGMYSINCSQKHQCRKLGTRPRSFISGNICFEFSNFRCSGKKAGVSH